MSLKLYKENLYNISLGQGLARNLYNTLFENKKPCKVMVVTDKNIDSIYGDDFYVCLLSMGFALEKIVFPPGESLKSIENFHKIIEKLEENSFSKSDCLIAMGGGTIGDLSGFAAATFLRGIDFIQMPTTLLSMVDSSIGGKNGVNLESGKNLLGTIYQPVATLIDPLFLKTLPKEEIKNGLSEVIKAGIIEDSDILSMLQSSEDIYKEDLDFFERLIIKACKVKLKIIEEDLLEASKRQILNLGHTLGHAIEKASEYKISHGSAVAFGISSISKAAYLLKIIPKDISTIINPIYESLGFDFTDIYNLNKNSIIKYANMDKKINGENINLILTRDIEDVSIHEISKDKLKDIINIIWAKDLIMINPKTLSGTINMPISKSIYHRRLFSKAITSILSGCDFNPYEILTEPICNDLKASANALNQLVKSFKNGDSSLDIDVLESGSTLRFILPMASSLFEHCYIKCGKSLINRPISPLKDLLEENGTDVEVRDDMIITSGLFSPKSDLYLTGSISSQFFSGLLFFMALTGYDKKVYIKGRLESKPYLEMTISVLRALGFNVMLKDSKDTTYMVFLGKLKSTCEHNTHSNLNEGDWSCGSFFHIANAMGSNIKIDGLNSNSLQGDKKILEFIASIENSTADTSINMGDNPDLVPILSLLPLFLEKTVTFTHIDRLKFKESNRILSTMEMLNSMGAKAYEKDGTLTVCGGHKLSGGVISSFNDHRIAMTAAIASSICEKEIFITDYKCVDKSYPEFFEDFSALGGEIYNIKENYEYKNFKI